MFTSIITCKTNFFYGKTVNEESVNLLYILKL